MMDHGSIQRAIDANHFDHDQVVHVSQATSQEA